MADTSLRDAEIVRRSRGIDDARVRNLPEPTQDGRFIAIGIDSGDCEVAGAAVETMDKLDPRHAAALCYIHRIGYASVFALGTVAPGDSGSLEL